jgi:atypical dual specificity phosphatase
MSYRNRSHLKTVSTLRYSNFPLQASEIIPRLYIADMYTATDDLTLEHLGITHIVAVVEYPRPCPANLKQICLPLTDEPWENISCHLDSAVEWIKGAIDADENAKVMVHCMCGKSRSASVVIAYIMATQRSPSLTETLAQVKAKRRIVGPNSGFMKQLKEYEGKLRRLEETAMLTD